MRLVYPQLNAGDCMLFTSLTVHGSSKNFSSHRRRSVVIQAQSKNVPKFDNSIYNKEVKYRHDFVIKTIRTNQKTWGGNLYNDLSKRN